MAVADNPSRAYGQPNPPLTISYSGFVNGDTESVLNVLPVASTTAASNSVVGNYGITLAGGMDDNYALVLSNGVLTVTAPQAAPVVMITSVVMLDADHFRLNGSGVANVSYTVQASTDLVQWSPIGTVQADGAGAFEYVDATVAGADWRYYRLAAP